MKLVAAVLPKLTAVAPVKSVPVIVTDVPPVVKPLEGLRLVTAGGATIPFTCTEAVEPTEFRVVSAEFPAASLSVPPFTESDPTVIPSLSKSPD